MSSSTPPQTGRSAAVGLFESAQQARQAVQALTQSGVDQGQVGLLIPGALASGGDAQVSGLLMASGGAGDLGRALSSMGLPEGETRFYIQEVDSGRALIVVDGTQDYATAREVLLSHGGYDVQSRGAELARADDAGVPGGTGARPIDVTGRWEDVASRYEMLWQQHYGTSDATWEQMAPVYRYAWDAANDPNRRGRPWSEVEPVMRREWESRQSAQWDAVAGPIQDVWDDVAEEAATLAEGGQDRRVARPRE